MTDPTMSTEPSNTTPQALDAFQLSKLISHMQSQHDVVYEGYCSCSVFSLVAFCLPKSLKAASPEPAAASPEPAAASPEPSNGKGKSDASMPKGKGKTDVSMQKGKNNSDASTPKGKGKSEASMGKGKGDNQVSPLQVFEGLQLLHQKVDRLTQTNDMLHQKVDRLTEKVDTLLHANASAAASGSMATGSMASGSLASGSMQVAPIGVVSPVAPWQGQFALAPYGNSSTPPGLAMPPPPPAEPDYCKYRGKDWCQAFFHYEQKNPKK